MTTHHDAGHRTDHGHEELEDHDLGLSHDLPKILARRGLLTVFGRGGVCGGRGLRGGRRVEHLDRDSVDDLVLR